MIVTCPNCTTRYNLPDSKIPAGGAKVKCSKCAHVFKAELPPASPEEEVENLFDEESQAAPDTQAGDEFDDAFDEVSSGGAAADEPPADEPAADEAVADDAATDEAPAADEPVEESSDVDDLFDDVGDTDDTGDTDEGDEGDDLPGVDDLFDEPDDTPAPEEGASPSGGEESSASADEVDSLFGDDDGGLFDEEEVEDDTGDDAGDDELFEEGGDDEEDDTDDLFADADDVDDEEYDESPGFGLDDEESEPKKKGGKSLGCLIIVLVLALGLGAAVYFKVWTMFGVDLGSYFQNVPYVGKMFMEETGGDEEPAPGVSPAERVRKIELKNVKQYYVANEKTGNLFVVEGKAVNKFAKPKEQIKVEVVLYDGAGTVLASQSFLCGNVLSQFQLQVQTQKEIEDGLASEVGILSNNTFIRPGASTPFMAVFFQPPANVKEFLVKVVDVGDPE